MVSKEEIMKRVIRDMKMKGLYKDGKKEGKQLVYNKGGKLKTTQIWKNNKLLEEIKQ